MTPQYPLILYPLQKYNDHGVIPYIIPLFLSFNENIFMLWMLCGMLTQIEKKYGKWYQTKNDINQDGMVGFWLIIQIKGLLTLIPE